MEIFNKGSGSTSLAWSQIEKYVDHVKDHGIRQFINHYHRHKGREGDCFKWGDETEYMIVKLDHQNRRARLVLEASQLLEKLRKVRETNKRKVGSEWQPEYSEFLLEGTPGRPFGPLVQHFNTVEHNMRFRRNQIQSLLKDDEVVISLANFPRLGCPDFLHPPASPDPSKGITRSYFFPDAAIAPKPRYISETINIRKRRKEKISINVPVFVDLKTPRPFVEDFSKYGDDEESSSQAKVDHIFLDAEGFGKSCCSLQVTIQASNLDEARFLFDQLTPLCPIMLSLTVGSPVYRGYLSDTDSRWDVLAASADCRTKEERDLEPLKNNRFVIPKSRFSSVNGYLSKYGSRYNDTLVYDKKVKQRLMDNGVDEGMAQHIAYLFIRDPIFLIKEKLHQDDDKEIGHFENMNITNWQSVRFKAPPVNGDMGWRVEFRPCEVQLTDFENAAVAVFVILLTRVILSFKLDLLIPISKVDENMSNSQKRNAVLEQKFWFRKDVFSMESCDGEDDLTRMTVNEIINGKVDEFVGLVPLVHQYLRSLDIDVDTAHTINQYLNFISSRAAGTLSTTAAWIRKFVTSHPDYKQDSVVSEGINYDLIVACSDISQGKRECQELHGGTPKTKTSEDIPEDTAVTYMCKCHHE